MKETYKINKIIRNKIKEKGMTFKFVQEKSGIAYQPFYRLVNGKKIMSVDELNSILKVINVSSDEILKELRE